MNRMSLSLWVFVIELAKKQFDTTRNYFICKLSEVGTSEGAMNELIMVVSWSCRQIDNNKWLLQSSESIKMNEINS